VSNSYPVGGGGHQAVATSTGERIRMKLTLKELAESVQVGYQARGAVEEDTAGSHLLIQMRDLREDGTINTASLTRFTPDRMTEQYIVADGDVLLQVRGMKHKAAVVCGLPAETLASSHFYILRADRNRVLPGYLAWYINQPLAQSHLLTGAQGAGNVTVVTRVVFESLEIPIPPLEKQYHIVALDRLQWQERELTTRLQAARAQWTSALCLHIAQDKPINTRTNAQ